MINLSVYLLCFLSLVSRDIPLSLCVVVLTKTKKKQERQKRMSRHEYNKKPDERNNNLNDFCNINCLICNIYWYQKGTVEYNVSCRRSIKNPNTCLVDLFFRLNWYNLNNPSRPCRYLMHNKQSDEFSGWLVRAVKRYRNRKSWYRW